MNEIVSDLVFLQIIQGYFLFRRIFNKINYKKYHNYEYFFQK